jgi:hypothetical protein
MTPALQPHPATIRVVPIGLRNKTLTMERLATGREGEPLLLRVMLKLMSVTRASGLVAVVSA